MRSNIPAGYFSRLNRVMGRVVSAKGLPKSENTSIPDPFVVIKGIRSSNHLSNMHITDVISSTFFPEWNENFDFEVPANWGIVELVGLRLMVFSADDQTTSDQGSDYFLGGVDLDMSDMVTGRTVTQCLELGGVPQHMVRGGHKPRLTLVVTVYHEVVPRPAPLTTQLMNSIRQVSYVREITGRLVRAKNLRNADFLGVSDPVCVVRVLLISGEMREIARTGIILDSLNPEFALDFQILFEVTDQPLLIIFDMFDSDDPNMLPEETGDHLGTAVVPLVHCLPPNPRKRDLVLQGPSARYETRLDREGHPISDLGRSATHKGGEVETGRETPYERLKRSGKRLKDSLFKIAGSLSSPEESTLTVETRSRIKKDVMPHIRLSDKGVSIVDSGDVEVARSHADWDKGMFELPEELQLEEGEQPMRGLLQAEPRIIFIYGSILGANGLIQVVPKGRNDAYVIVDGVTRTAETCFIHRTRIVKDTMCPEWSESFCWAVPAHLEITRLVFTVYHAKGDSGSPEEMEDDFLGHASLDLTYLFSGDTISEDIPISGAQTKYKTKVTNGFRRSATVSVEVMLERRMKPTYGVVEQEQLAMLPRRNHLLSREPVPSRAFQDVSQEITTDEPEVEAATDVVEMYSTGQLKPAKQDIFTRRNRLWNMVPPDTGAPSQKERDEARLRSEDAFKALHDRLVKEKNARLRQVNLEGGAREQEQILDEGTDFTKSHSLRRPKSLPTLKSKFGVDPTVFLTTITSLGSNPPEPVSVNFDVKKKSYVTDSLKNAFHQPRHDEVLTRGRPGSTPEQFFRANKVQQKFRRDDGLHGTLPPPTR